EYFGQLNAGVERSELSFPQQLAGQVIAVQPFRREGYDQPFSVGRRGAVGVAALEMALYFRLTLAGGAGPEDLSAVAVEAQPLPDMRTHVIGRGDVAVVADAPFGFPLGADGRGHEHAVAPDDGAGVSQARNRRLPTNVDVGADVPGKRRVLPVGNSRA